MPIITSTQFVFKFKDLVAKQQPTHAVFTSFVNCAIWLEWRDVRISRGYRTTWEGGIESHTHTHTHTHKKRCIFWRGPWESTINSILESTINSILEYQGCINLPKAVRGHAIYINNKMRSLPLSIVFPVPVLCNCHAMLFARMAEILSAVLVFGEEIKVQTGNRRFLNNTLSFCWEQWMFELHLHDTYTGYLGLWVPFLSSFTWVALYKELLIWLSCCSKALGWLSEFLPYIIFHMLDWKRYL